MYAKLQYISDGTSVSEQLNSVKAALDAGCKWVQLRFKNAEKEILENTAVQIKKICEQYNAVFIVNDNVAIAKKVNADGVHLGLKDMPVAEARTLLGHDKIIGGTANTIQDIELRIQENCNYIGLGPLRFTATKKELSPVLGYEGYAAIMNKISNANVPVYAIGGIVKNDIEPLMKAGVFGIAVSSLINKNPYPDFIHSLNMLLNG